MPNHCIETGVIPCTAVTRSVRGHPVGSTQADHHATAWQARNPTRPYVPANTVSSLLSGHRRGDVLYSALTQFAPTPAQVLNVDNLYTYDSLDVD